MLAGGGGLLALSITNDGLIARNTAMGLGGLGLFLSGLIQLAYVKRVADARVDRERARGAVWRAGPVLDAGPGPDEPTEKPARPTTHVRLVPVGGPAAHTFASQPADRPVVADERILVDGVDQDDLFQFIADLTLRGHSRSRWLNVKLPSGRVVTKEYYAALIAPLVKINAIVGRGERASGSLVMTPPEIRKRLGLGAARPNLTIDLA